MRTQTLYGTITAMMIAGALSVSAQTPQTQTAPPTPGDQRSGSDQTVTVTGCLQQNNAMGMSGSGSAGSTGSATGSGSTAGSSAASTGSTSASGSSQGRASNFMLANAKMAQGSSTSALGSTTRFSLIGMADAELSKHLNHQVEVTGRLSGAMSGSNPGNPSGSATGTTGSTGSTGSATGSTGSTGSGSTGGTGSGSTGSTAGTTGRSGGAMGSGTGMSDMPQLHATNLKMISATCPAQQ